MSGKNIRLDKGGFMRIVEFKEILETHSEKGILFQIYNFDNKPVKVSENYIGLYFSKDINIKKYNTDFIENLYFKKYHELNNYEHLKAKDILSNKKYFKNIFLNFYISNSNEHLVMNDYIVFIFIDYVADIYKKSDVI